MKTIREAFSEIRNDSDRSEISNGISREGRLTGIGVCVMCAIEVSITANRCSFCADRLRFSLTSSLLHSLSAHLCSNQIARFGRIQLIQLFFLSRK